MTEFLSVSLAIVSVICLLLAQRWHRAACKLDEERRLLSLKEEMLRAIRCERDGLESDINLLHDRCKELVEVARQDNERVRELHEERCAELERRANVAMRALRGIEALSDHDAHSAGT